MGFSNSSWFGLIWIAVSAERLMRCRKFHFLPGSWYFRNIHRKRLAFKITFLNLKRTFLKRSRKNIYEFLLPYQMNRFSFPFSLRHTSKFSGWCMWNKRTQDFGEREAEQGGTSGLKNQHSGELQDFLFVLNTLNWVWATLHPGSTNIGKKKGRDVGKEENKPLKANSLPKGPEKKITTQKTLDSKCPSLECHCRVGGETNLLLSQQKPFGSL